jgi:hypothetical protein
VVLMRWRAKAATCARRACVAAHCASVHMMPGRNACRYVPRVGSWPWRPRVARWRRAVLMCQAKLTSMAGTCKISSKHKDGVLGSKAHRWAAAASALVRLQRWGLGCSRRCRLRVLGAARGGTTGLGEDPELRGGVDDASSPLVGVAVKQQGGHGGPACSRFVGRPRICGTPRLPWLLHGGRKQSDEGGAERGLGLGSYSLKPRVCKGVARRTDDGDPRRPSAARGRWPASEPCGARRGRGVKSRPRHWVAWSEQLQWSP